MSDFGRKKNRRKALRVVLQGIILAFLGYFLVTAFIITPQHRPAALSGNDTGGAGFIALSYQGIRLEDSRSAISGHRFNEHLAALAERGFVSVSQQNILDYYSTGAPLPERSLFLFFEDGRRDTVNFAQPHLENNNFMATMFTFANNLHSNDPGFLRPRDLRRLQNNSFWELGTQGYRLHYINAFDRDDEFLGMLSPLEHAEHLYYLDGDYNHYLMDFIRDAYGVPQETPEELRERISADYRRMHELYTEEIGGLPGLYMLMHSNSPHFGTHERAGEVNEGYIREMFDMHFNREGISHNTREDEIYNLTRVQVLPHWRINHLLMRIKHDTGKDLDFVTGDTDRAAEWDIIRGAAQFDEGTIALTSPPRGWGYMSLNGETMQDLQMTFSLQGAIIGEQRVFLRANEDLSRYISVGISDNVLTVTERAAGESRGLFSLDLSEFDGVPYVPHINPSEMGYRDISITLSGSTLTVTLDGTVIADGITVEHLDEGRVVLGSSYSEMRFGHWDISDDIYDAIFGDVVVSSIGGEAIHDGRLRGTERLLASVKRIGEEILGWFIRTF